MAIVSQLSPAPAISDAILDGIAYGELIDLDLRRSAWMNPWPIRWFIELH